MLRLQNKDVRIDLLVLEKIQGLTATGIVLMCLCQFHVVEYCTF